jgi:hypothetical protein
VNPVPAVDNDSEDEREREEEREREGERKSAAEAAPKSSTMSAAAAALRALKLDDSEGGSIGNLSTHVNVNSSTSNRDEIHISLDKILEQMSDLMLTKLT